MRKIIVIFSFLIAVRSNGQNSGYDNILNYYGSEKNFNGVVLAATNGRIDYLNAVGIANRQSGTTLNTKGRFKVASITKTFTAVLTLQLYQEGKLDLNGTIGQYLDSYTGEAKNKVSIQHLLTYSSGIPNCEGNTGIEVYQKPISVDDFISRHCSGKLEFEPGKQFSYDNGDYIILGRIIEKLTGKSFAQNLKERILFPLSMQNTGMLATKDIVTGLAPTYNMDESTSLFFVDDPMYIENYFSAGAMYSTAEDLLLFDNAIFSYKLLNKKTVDLMLTPFPELYSVAIGFWVIDNTFGNLNLRAANRQGSIWGANANWLHLIDNNKTFIVLSNTNATNLQELTEQLVLVSTGQKSTLPAAYEIENTEKYNFENVRGAWIIDLRPDPNSDAYLKDFIINPIKDKSFGGEFYGTAFETGKFNTDWEFLYFAFTTNDNDNTYFHSGYIDGGKIFGISYSPEKKFISHWTGVKKAN
jgi:CubicO group peptidase (beta-lactamase class C family)